MKIGLIFECGPEGADKKVCEALLKLIREWELIEEDVEVNSITLDVKTKLIEECGTATVELLNDGCERVVIVWDLYPPWREDKQKPCRKEDREKIFAKLNEANLDLAQIHLVCIQEELEAWLIADGRAISAALSKPHRQVKIKDQKNAERVHNPKKHLNQIFQKHIGRPYEDRTHAKHIIENLPDVNRIKRCETFVRFVLKATGKEL